MFVDKLMDAGRDDAENAEIRTLRDVDSLELRIGGHEPRRAISPATKLLHREIAIQTGDDDGTVSCRETSIDNQDVP